MMDPLRPAFTLVRLSKRLPAVVNNFNGANAIGCDVQDHPGISEQFPGWSDHGEIGNKRGGFPS